MFRVVWSFLSCGRSRSKRRDGFPLRVSDFRSSLLKLEWSEVFWVGLDFSSGCLVLGVGRSWVSGFLIITEKSDLSVFALSIFSHRNLCVFTFVNGVSVGHLLCVYRGVVRACCGSVLCFDRER